MTNGSTGAVVVGSPSTMPQPRKPRNFRFVAPAVEFSNVLKAVYPISVPGDSAAQFDSIRIDVSGDSLVTVSAASPMMMGAATVPDVDVIAAGCVDIAPRVAKELAEVALQKVTASGPVEVEVAVSADFIEMEMVYGLPVCSHKTRRPTQSPRQPLEGVAEHVSEVVQSMFSQPPSGVFYSDSVVTRATPTQELALQKAAKAIGAVMSRFPSGISSKFVATAPQLAIVWVCNPDGSNRAEDAPAKEPDGSEDSERIAVETSGRRVVVARPLEGLS